MPRIGKSRNRAEPDDTLAKSGGPGPVVALSVTRHGQVHGMQQMYTGGILKGGQTTSAISGHAGYPGYATKVGVGGEGTAKDATKVGVGGGGTSKANHAAAEANKMKHYERRVEQHRRAQKAEVQLKYADKQNDADQRRREG